MSKFSRDLDSTLETMVKTIAAEVGLKEAGINVEPIAVKSKKDIGMIIKANELVELFTGDDSIVCCALNERAFERVNKEVQEMWIRSLLSQIAYDFDKDKILITKPELNISLGMYQKYGEQAVKNAELGILTLQQIAEEDEELKKSKKKK